MSTQEKEKLEHGAEVAKELGWPEDEIGVLGAAGGLVQLGAPHRRPRSSRRLLDRYRARSGQAVRDRVTRSIRRMYR